MHTHKATHNFRGESAPSEEFEFVSAKNEAMPTPCSARCRACVRALPARSLVTLSELVGWKFVMWSFVVWKLAGCAAEEKMVCPR